MREHCYCVYILTNKNNTVLYIGITNNIIRRITEHREKRNPSSFSSRYNCTKLVYYSCGDYVNGAIEQEKQLKNISRKKKEALIAELNPQWRDLSFQLGL